MHKKVILQKLQTDPTKRYLRTKIFLEAIRTLGKGMSCKGASMAQSSGDGKLPRTGPRPVTITTQQKIPFLGEAYHGSSLTSWWLVTCCGLTNSGRYNDFDLILLGDSGGTVLRNAISRTPKTISLGLSCSLVPALKGRWLSGSSLL